ncbi:MAG TPA: GGDEF domain-containing protein [Gemmatimonadaceae bacterium]|nr:GGDEF domain-containing protein [Gemmatimonadaceae bacterium]
MAHSYAVFFAPDAQQPPDAVRGWLDARGLEVIICTAATELLAMALRGRPRVVIFDARRCTPLVLDACRSLKADPYTSVIPGGVLVAGGEGASGAAFDAEADEVILPGTPLKEALQRLDVMLRRADRDVHVHPSTRLPGAPQIEAQIADRIASGELFAVCYADLDHFKEYNDRYSYCEGDRVIRILAKVLHDVVRGLCQRQGFVGHIGGDDFIFLAPIDSVPVICQEIIEVFDALVPYQYSEQDREAGYFFGKDRRGQLHRVPLMTVSIGVVTNERRSFPHPGRVSELATEMKSYAKTLPGSVFVVDRRQDACAVPVGAPEQP